MSRHYSRVDKNHPYICDITNVECDFDNRLGIMVCNDCGHYHKWRGKKSC